ncbi:MAG TPA: hypothetical protein VMN57_07765 [Anaerolineales bacterium]|nr:hypothetical protein [Anaerolineales bacterium]
MIAETRDVELDCDGCFAEMNHFVDLLIEGKHPDEAMPLVRRHLDICGECHEEFEALFAAIQAII